MHRIDADQAKAPHAPQSSTLVAGGRVGDRVSGPPWAKASHPTQPAPATAPTPEA